MHLESGTMAATTAKRTADGSAVIGVFDTREAAERSVDELIRKGYKRDQVGVIAKNADGKVTAQDADGNAGEGAAIGAATGAGVAGLVSLGISFGVIPAIGPILAMGPLAAALLSAAGGAAAAGLAGALIGWGIPEDEAAFYESEVEAGKFLVTVKAEKNRDDAWKTMQQGGAYNRQTADAKTMKLHEERLRARKENVQTGEVTLRKETTVEHKTIEVPVKKEEVVIERRSVRDGVAASADLKDGETIRVPVSEERVRVEKTPVVTEEVSVGKRVVETTEKVEGDVRKEKVRVVPKGDVKVDHGSRGTGRR
jgi:uncharacterized protein (TIGR02271 family)